MLCKSLRALWRPRTRLLGGLLILMALAVPSPGRAAEPAAAVRLRVMTYNIHHSEGTDGRVDLQRIADVIRKAKPDLVALQEVDQKTQRTGGVEQTAELSRLTGLRGYFGRQIDYEGGEYGQALLSRFEMTDLKVQWLPGMPDRERRIVYTGRFELAGQEILFGSTHLHHNNAPFRLQQTQELNRLFGSADTPVVLAGDLNAVPDSEPLQTLRKSWDVAANEEALLTFPAPQPERQLDYILSRPAGQFQLERVEVIPEPLASDHRPLVAEYVFVPQR